MQHQAPETQETFESEQDVIAHWKAELEAMAALRKDRELAYHTALMALELGKLLAIHARAIRLDDPAAVAKTEENLLRLLLELLSNAEIDSEYWSNCLKPAELSGEYVALYLFSPGEK